MATSYRRSVLAGRREKAILESSHEDVGCDVLVDCQLSFAQLDDESGSALVDVNNGAGDKAKRSQAVKAAVMSRGDVCDAAASA